MIKISKLDISRLELDPRARIVETYKSIPALCREKNWPMYYLRKLGLPCTYKNWRIEWT